MSPQDQREAIVVRFAFDDVEKLRAHLGAELRSLAAVSVVTPARPRIGSSPTVVAQLSDGRPAFELLANVIAHPDPQSLLVQWLTEPGLSSGAPAEVASSEPDLVIDAVLADYGHTAVDQSAKPAPLAEPTATRSSPLPVTPTAVADLPAFEQLSSYQILKRLGGGGMAQVYLARSRLGGQVDKLVALKTVLPEFGPSTPLGALFLEEARVSATLQHANVVQVFDYGEADGRPFLAMEYVLGRTVGAVLQRQVKEQRLPKPEVVVAVGIEVCRALEYVHARTAIDGSPLNLVHRDVSPSNVMLSVQGEVKLLDFGIVSTDGATSQFSSGQAVGKYGYMAAEQAKGGAPSPHWDLYSLGVVLYEMLTQRRFSKVNTAQEVISDVRLSVDRKPSLVMPTIIPELDAVVVKATAPGPERFQSAAEMRAALTAVQKKLGPADLQAFVVELFGDSLREDEAASQQLVLEGRSRVSIPPRPITVAPQPTVPPRRSGLFVGAAALAVLAVGGFLAWPRPVPTPVPAPQPVVKVEPVLPAVVTATIASVPAGAEVFDAATGVSLGHTPFSLERPRSDDELSLRFELSEHQMLQKTVRLTTDVSVDVAMVPNPRPDPPPTPVLPGKKKPQPQRKGVVKDGFVDPFAQ